MNCESKKELTEKNEIKKQKNNKKKKRKKKELREVARKKTVRDSFLTSYLISLPIKFLVDNNNIHFTELLQGSNKFLHENYLPSKRNTIGTQ